MLQTRHGIFGEEFAVGVTFVDRVVRAAPAFEEAHEEVVCCGVNAEAAAIDKPSCGRFREVNDFGAFVLVDVILVDVVGTSPARGITPVEHVVLYARTESSCRPCVVNGWRVHAVGERHAFRFHRFRVQAADA